MPKKTIASQYSCPKCGRDEHIDSKLTTFDIGREYFFGDAYYVKNEGRFKQSELVNGDFISAQFCSACELAFLPDEILSSIGVAVTDFRGSFSPYRPLGNIGHLRSDDSVRNEYEKGVWEAVVIFGDDRREIRTSINELDIEDGDVRAYLHKKYSDAEIISLTNEFASNRIRTNRIGDGF